MFGLLVPPHLSDLFLRSADARGENWNLMAKKSLLKFIRGLNFVCPLLNKFIVYRIFYTFIQYVYTKMVR